MNMFILMPLPGLRPRVEDVEKSRKVCEGHGGQNIKLRPAEAKRFLDQATSALPPILTANPPLRKNPKGSPLRRKSTSSDHRQSPHRHTRSGPYTDIPSRHKNPPLLCLHPSMNLLEGLERPFQTVHYGEPFRRLWLRIGRNRPQ